MEMHGNTGGGPPMADTTLVTMLLVNCSVLFFYLDNADVL